MRTASFSPLTSPTTNTITTIATAIVTTMVTSITAVNTQPSIIPLAAAAAASPSRTTALLGRRRLAARLSRLLPLQPLPVLEAGQSLHSMPLTLRQGTEVCGKL